MRRVRARRRVTVGARTSGATGRTAQSVAGDGTTPIGRRRRVRLRRTVGVCTTCTGTCGSGWRTAGTRTTLGRRATGRRGRAAETVVAVCCGAVPGAALRCTCVRRIATTTMPARATSTAAFVCRGRSINSWNFSSLPLGVSGARRPPAIGLPALQGGTEHGASGRSGGRIDVPVRAVVGAGGGEVPAAPEVSAGRPAAGDGARRVGAAWRSAVHARPAAASGRGEPGYREAAVTVPAAEGYGAPGRAALPVHRRRRSATGWCITRCTR